jgi:hypothetical protein
MVKHEAAESISRKRTESPTDRYKDDLFQHDDLLSFEESSAIAVLPQPRDGKLHCAGKR